MELTAKQFTAIKLAAIKSGNRPSKWDRETVLQWARDNRPELLGCEPAPISPNVAPAPTPVEAPTPEPRAKGTLEEAIEEIARRAASESVNEARVLELIREHAPRHAGSEPLSIEIIDLRQEGRVELLEDVHHAMPDVLTVVRCKKPLYLVGAAGSGKTTLGFQVAKALGTSVYATSAVKQEHKLLGFIDAAGKYHTTQFRQAFEHGGVFIADEMDSWSGEATIVANMAFANRKCEFPDVGLIEAHADFRVIACANTYGKGADRIYVGRNPLDGATLDRFVFIDVDYDEALEAKLTRNEYLENCRDFGTQPDESTLINWLGFVRAVRAKAWEKKIRHVVSPRASLNGVALLAAGMSKAKVAEMVVWKGLAEDQRAQIAVAA